VSLTDLVVFVVSREIAAEGVRDVVGPDSEDVDGDAADFRLAGAFGLSAEAFEPLAVFAGDLFDDAHGWLQSHLGGINR
jgi:hypothetical protein